MKIEEAAKELSGNEYGKEGSPYLFAKMKDAQLVAVFGASDDLMEFRGAIYDEVGCYNGGSAHVSQSGLPQNDCEDEDCPYFSAHLKNLPTIDAIWDDNSGFTFETQLPHATFDIMEDGEKYCTGLVFWLGDTPPPNPPIGGRQCCDY